MLLTALKNQNLRRQASQKTLSFKHRTAAIAAYIPGFLVTALSSVGSWEKQASKVVAASGREYPSAGWRINSITRCTGFGSFKRKMLVETRIPSNGSVKTKVLSAP